MDNYKEKYEQALERARQFSEKPYLEDSAGIVEYIFPELKESEDEKIKKTLIDYFKTYKKQEECGIKTFFGIPTDNIISWLEKQGEQKSEEIDNLHNYLYGEQKPAEPNWVHHKVDLSGCSEEYCKAYYDGWNNCNQQHAQLKAEQKPIEWSETDKLKMETIIHVISNQRGSAIFEGFLPEELINWLNDIKDRVQPQPKLF